MANDKGNNNKETNRQSDYFEKGNQMSFRGKPSDSQRERLNVLRSQPKSPRSNNSNKGR